ncbi:MAG TPA: ABC-2 family transporter protein [Chloroflexota bacterium]|nr:ABC-2 family transporter protein [Chloroflexota bacterium]
MVRLLLQEVRVNALLTLEYRSGFVIYQINNVAGPAVSLLIWLTVQEHAAAGLPLDRSKLVTYFLLLGVVSMLTSAWTAEYLAEDIRTGALSRYLLRPAPMMHQAGNNVGEKLIKLILIAPLVILVGLAFRTDVRLEPDAARWLCVAVAVVLAAALTLTLDFLIGAAAFWLQDVSGLIALEALVASLLAGRFVPLALFPPELGPLLRAQPWRYLLSFPLEIATGTLDAPGIAAGLGTQVAYLLVTLALFRWVWARGLRGYAAVGA